MVDAEAEESKMEDDEGDEGKMDEDGLDDLVSNDTLFSFYDNTGDYAD